MVRETELQVLGSAVDVHLVATTKTESKTLRKELEFYIETFQSSL
jgi:hypothetical protein